MNLIPLHDRVLVISEDAEAKTKAGIIIPETSQEKPLQGKVVAVGKGWEKPMTVKKGDIIKFGKFAGTELEHEGVNYLIMRESDIFCIVKS